MNTNNSRIHIEVKELPQPKVKVRLRTPPFSLVGRNIAPIPSNQFEKQVKQIRGPVRKVEQREREKKVVKGEFALSEKVNAHGKKEKANIFAGKKRYGVVPFPLLLDMRPASSPSQPLVHPFLYPFIHPHTEIFLSFR